MSGRRVTRGGVVGGGLGGKLLSLLVPAIGSLVGGTDNLAGTGGLSATSPPAAGLTIWLVGEGRGCVLVS
jgi:hypothetical protein